MTAKDYWRIANALNKARCEVLGPTPDNPQVGEALSASAIDIAAEYIADELAADNPRFNRHRFLSAVWGVGVLR